MTGDKVKVVHVITTIERGGAEKQLLLLAQEQVLNGYEVQVVPLKGKPELEAEFAQIGATIFPYPKSILQAIRNISKLSSEESAIFHAHLPRAELISRLGLFRRNCIFVITRHNAEGFFPSVRPFISRVLSRWVTRRAQGVIAISKAVERFLTDNREVGKDIQIHCIYYGISLKKTNYHLNVSEREFGFKIATVSRLVPQKNIPLILNAFADLNSKESSWKLTIVGSGPLKNDLIQLSERLKLGNRVEWIEKIDLIDEYLETIDVFVLASDYEGFGLVLLEAMRAKKPIIASDAPAVVEVLGPGYRGLFPRGDTQVALRKIEGISKSEYRDDLLSQLKERLIMFDIKKSFSQTHSLYQKLKTSASNRI